MEESQNVMYSFTRGERALFAEIYFPKKVVHQAAIFSALKDGLKEEMVKNYLLSRARFLVRELKGYKNLFNPYQYGEQEKELGYRPTLEDAKKRIGMYQSHFYGWSMNEIDGVWQGRKERIDEERTQIIRIIFRLPSVYSKEATKERCSDVLRSMLYWLIARQGNLQEHWMWSEWERETFLRSQHPWVNHKLEFARSHFSGVAKEVVKWRHDCGLFIFGFLVRQFADSVLAEHRREEEIWVTNFFDLNINVVRRVRFKKKGGGS